VYWLPPCVNPIAVNKYISYHICWPKPRPHLHNLCACEFWDCLRTVSLFAQNICTRTVSVVCGQDGKQQIKSVRLNVSTCSRTSFSVSLVYLQKLRCVRTKTFLLLLRICSAMHVDGVCICRFADYKNLTTKRCLTDVLEKKCKINVIKFKKKSPLAKYESGAANWDKEICVEFCVYSSDFGTNFWSKISKSFFVILTKFLKPEPSYVSNSRRRMCPYWPPYWNKGRVQTLFADFDRLFLLMTSIVHIPHTFQLHLHSATWQVC
jgi:hypothetical protein